MALFCRCVLVFAFVACCHGGFTLNDDGTLVADSSVKAICYGPCPPLAGLEDEVGIYVADGKEVRIGTDTYVKTDTSNGEIQWYTKNPTTRAKERFLTCYNDACVLGNAVPDNIAQYTPGTYMVGNVAFGTRGAWQIHSTMNMLGSGDAFMHRVSAISNSSIQGWAVDVPSAAWYVITTIGLMVVGENIGQDQILNAARTGGVGVISEKDIFINNAPGRRNVGTIALPVLGQSNIIRQSVYTSSSTSSSTCGAYSMRNLVMTEQIYDTTHCFSTTDSLFVIELCREVCKDCYSYFRLGACAPGTNSLSISLYKKALECSSDTNPTPSSIDLATCLYVNSSTTDTRAMIQCFNTL